MQVIFCGSKPFRRPGTSICTYCILRLVRLRHPPLNRLIQRLLKRLLPAHDVQREPRRLGPLDKQRKQLRHVVSLHYSTFLSNQHTGTPRIIQSRTQHAPGCQPTPFAPPGISQSQARPQTGRGGRSST